MTQYTELIKRIDRLFEKVGDVPALHVKIDSVSDDVKEIKKSLHGNGKIGLIDDHNNLKSAVRVITNNQEACLKLKREGKEKTEKKEERKFKLKAEIILLVLSNLLLLVMAVAQFRLIGK